MIKQAIFLGFFLTSFFLHAQETTIRQSDMPSNGHGSFQVMVMVPQGQFADNVPNLGGGFELQVAGRLKPGSMLLFGGNIGYALYGNSRDRRPWSSTLPDVELIVERSNNLSYLHGFIRLEPDFGIVRPYVQGEIGLKYMFTRTSVQGLDLINAAGNPNSFAGSLNMAGANLSAGPAAGVNIVLNQKPNQLLLTIGAKYLYGGPMQYLTERDVVIENNQVIYNRRWSTTDMLLIHAGISIKF